MEKEDLRVRKTKRALYDAFVELLSKKAFEEITVDELCKYAEIRRATFYKHYTDKFDFLTAFTRALRDRFDRTIWNAPSFDTTSKYYVAYAKRIVGYISEHEGVFSNIINSNICHVMIAIILEQNYKDTIERLENSVSAGMRLCASVETVASMCAGGVASTIYNWFANGKNKSSDRLAEEIGSVIQSILGNR